MLVIFLHLFKHNVVTERNKNQTQCPFIHITRSIDIKLFFKKLLVIGHNLSMHKQYSLGPTI